MDRNRVLNMTWISSFFSAVNVYSVLKGKGAGKCQCKDYYRYKERPGMIYFLTYQYYSNIFIALLLNYLLFLKLNWL